MILKSLNLDQSIKYNYFLIFGENDGIKDELINLNFLSKFKDNNYRTSEKDLLANIENFFNHIFTKSFFDKEKLIIVTDVSDKIYETIFEIIEKSPPDIKIILIGGLLEKKTKLRKLFEKEKNLVCVPCYKDNLQSISNLIRNFFNQRKITVSQEIINFLINQTNGNRKNLKNELNKIDMFINGKLKINITDIQNLVKSDENYDLNELIESCLSLNKKKALSILNENNFNQEDNIRILKIFLHKLKRLKNLLSQNKNNNNLEITINNYRPPIFWKDKDALKRQLKIYSLIEINKIIKNLNELEVKLKQRPQVSNQIIANFIIDKLNFTNNSI
jgi:DNA polymerase-3 subunit delta